ncbi:lipopolysaccharide biosynthesis protein [Pseudonocardia sp. H11422]|uniref:lipopolysaccharide biosynthesis protein n=1 Tax=Pseudonocardia sp. H11422 TaxID=2835866 RepID=UPI001BDC7FE1|nr:oligosaccharide flippase family protein [Pseudonocardia sp. H11422]
MTETVPDASSASRAVLGRGSLYTLASAAPVLAAVLVTPFVTRLLGADEYGVVALALVIVQVGAMAAGLGMVAAITRHGILERSGVDGARALVLQGSALAATVLAVATATSPWWIGPVMGVPWRPALALALVAAAGFAAVLNAQSFLRVLDRPLPFVALAAVATLGGPVVGLLLLQSAGADADEYAIGLLAGYAAAGVAGLVLALRGGRPRAGRGDLRRALRLGLPTVPHQVALFMAHGALVLVAARLLGPADGGRLQLALLVGSAPAMITAALNNAWAPVIYRTAPEHRAAALERTARDVAAVTALLAGGVALLAPYLMRILAPASYAPDELAAAVGVTAVGSVLSVAYLANVHLVFAAGRSTGLALVTPLSLVVGLAAALLAARSGELAAVAVGFPVTYLALAVGTALLRRRVAHTPWRQRAMALPLFAGSGACAVGAALPTSGTGAPARVALAAVLAIGLVAMAVRVARR